MKLKIKVKTFDQLQEPIIFEKGDWIDLRSAVNVTLPPPTITRAKKDSERTVVFSQGLVPLGVAMELPKGFEAVVNPRSSMFLKFGVVLANSQGVIDNSYNGDNDEWKANLISLTGTTIKQGDRIVQFRIQLSQKATVWQKLKWLFCNGIKLVHVGELDHTNRGGHGSTGVR